MMLADIEIVVSWGAFGTFATLIIAGLGAWGTIYWKISNHEKDNDRHLTGQEYVPMNLCKVTKDAIVEELKETRKYIGDVEGRQTKATENLKNDLFKKFDEFISFFKN